MKALMMVVAVLAMLVAGCQSATEQLNERLLEQATGVDDVDIDLETGRVSIETDEGSFTVGGGDVPDGFPVPLPDGYRVTGVFESGSAATVAVVYPSERYEAVVAFYDQWTANHPAEYTTMRQTMDLGDQGAIRSTGYDSVDIVIFVSDCYGVSGDPDEVCVNINIP